MNINVWLRSISKAAAIQNMKEEVNRHNEMPKVKLDLFSISEPVNLVCSNYNRVTNLCSEPTCKKTALICSRMEC